MLPSIKNGQRLRVERIDSKTRIRLARGDILVFKYPADPSRSYIKRLIGLPGDRVECVSGDVLINGFKVSEPYVDSRFNQSRRSFPAVTVPERSYFVMGDNRDNSSDSRIWGFVPEQSLTAKVVE